MRAVRAWLRLLFALTLGATALPATMYTISTGVVGPTITLQASDYQAWVSNLNTTRTCAIFIGTSTFAPATKEGEAKCN